jgi:hypothetical protein
MKNLYVSQNLDRSKIEGGKKHCSFRILHQFNITIPKKKLHKLTTGVNHIHHDKLVILTSLFYLLAI